ncbi:MAG: ABC transporter permease [Oscillospiraceae bacterium]|nr:ABC transporter permease [Oscillospiraceae bacterium]
MSILSKYTRRCLRQNRVRTLVTIIGIILSVSLFTAVSEGAYSGQQYLIHMAEAANGRYHAIYDGMQASEQADLRAQDGVEQVETLDEVGWAMVGEADSSYPYPYLYVTSMSENLPELVAVNLIEGRMPENSQELLLSTRASASTRASFHVGQTLNLTVGRRVTTSGQPIAPNQDYMGNGETLTDTQAQTYTVVGIYDRFSTEIEDYNLPGSLALTVGAAGPNYKTLFMLDDMTNVEEFLDTHSYGSGGQFNRTLLMFAGVTNDENLNTVFYTLEAILFALIFLGSVALIYNSFSISVSERTKQFGLLKSIGATNRQLRHAVLMEALLLCVIGIPIGLLIGCGGIGLTLHFLQPAFDTLISGNNFGAVPIRLVLNLSALALAAGIGLLTALVSAWIPAQRATRLSPIAAIRQSADVKVRAREVKVSRLTGKLFGFPGTLAAKNFKRSRKQYRATVISLFMSIVLFISAFSLSGSLRSQAAATVNLSVSDVIAFVSGFDSFPSAPDAPSMLETLLSVESVEDGAWAISESCDVSISPEALSEAYKAHVFQNWGDETIEEVETDPEMYDPCMDIFYVPDADYALLCQQAGVDPASGQALASNTKTQLTSTPSGDVRENVDLLRTDAAPISVTLHYALGGEEDLRTVDTEVVVGGFLKELPLASSDQYSLYLPISQITPELQKDLEADRWGGYWFFLRAANHAKAEQDVRKLLTSLSTKGENGFFAYDMKGGNDTTQAALLVLDVFTFGFIVLISLIAAANVFNTISTNVALRRREFATLKSVGMGERAFGRMMRFECLLYGSKALLWGLPVSIGISWLIWYALSTSFRAAYHLPWLGLAIAIGSVFLVVFATMLYATHKIRKDNPIDALKTETL